MLNAQRNDSDTNNAAILKGNTPEGEDLQTDALESLVDVVFTPSPSSADHSEAFKCGQCSKICSNAGALKRHIESHEPRECRHCGEFVYRDEKRNIGQVWSINHFSLYFLILKNLLDICLDTVCV